MQSAPPPAPTPADSLDLFSALAALLQHAGARIRFAALDDAATWDAATRTLTLRADAQPEQHAYALGEFCRHTFLGSDFSHFIATAPPRHLRAVT